MRLKSKNNYPPNGYPYFSAETNWTLPNPWLSFDECVRQIVTHRQGNPRFNLATDWNMVATDLEQYTCARLLSTPGGRDYIIEDGNAPPPNFPNRRPLAQRLADVAGAGGKVTAGIKTLKDWLGDGLRPVAPALAEQRAQICAVCPLNSPIGNLAEVAGDMAVKLIEVKNQMKLNTSVDEKLGQCTACLCLLKAKVFAPLEHILAHQTPEIEAALDKSCWIRNRDQIPA